MNEKLLAELEEVSHIACHAMKKYDGVDIANVPKEYHGYREIYSKINGILDRHAAEPEEGGLREALKNWASGASEAVMSRGLRGKWSLRFDIQERCWVFEWIVRVFGKPTWCRTWKYSSEFVDHLRPYRKWKRLLLCYRDCRDELGHEVREVIRGGEEV